MSGHSKWHNIAKKKGAADAKRGQVFSKIAKAISVAAREGGGDVSTNFTLRLAIEKAKAVNMPKDNIERAVARGTGEGGEGALENVVYEGMAPGGASVIIEAVTDNKNRTFSEVRNVVERAGGNLNAKVMWQFAHKGVIRGTASAEVDKDALEMRLIESGAEDITWEEQSIEIIGAKEDLQTLEGAAREAGIAVASAELEYVATQTVPIDEAAQEKLESFLEALDENDDVSNVYTNAA